MFICFWREEMAVPILGHCSGHSEGVGTTCKKISSQEWGPDKPSVFLKVFNLSKNTTYCLSVLDVFTPVIIYK